MPSLMATSLRWRTHSARTKNAKYYGHFGAGARTPLGPTFLAKGGHTMVILCIFSHYWTLVGTYLNVDDSKTIFSGIPVKSSFIWACSPSRLSGVTKNCENIYLLFWMFLTKRNTFNFFPKK